MTEGFEHLQPLDLIGDRSVVIEIGPGYHPEQNMLERLENVDDLVSGKSLYVAIDDKSYNLEHVTHGVVTRMSLQDFASSDLHNGKAESIYIFNVFGEPFSSASDNGFHAEVFKGLGRKLQTGGRIIIGEHITPLRAAFLREDLQRFRNIGLEPRLVTGYRDMLRELRELGFSVHYRNAFLGQSEENIRYEGPKAGGFLLILTKI
ncbi:hypothetical protein HY968_01350 [Candidatus Kaiserbacteria bacterium]|nr:hypothetical protein [Candidatus Kaiserbacteria bacterium]